MSPSTAPALRIEGVHKSFGALVALENLSLDVVPGQIHGLIGPNGAGKTTAINIATGFYRPDKGSISISGRDVTRMTTHERALAGLSRTFQGGRPFGKLSARKTLRIAVEQRLSALGESASRAVVLSRADELLERAQLSEIADEPSENLPYGNLKQLEIARSLAFASKVLLLDEPTSGLSEAEIARSMALITTYNPDIAIVIIEHNMDVIMTACDEVTVIDAGRWLAAGKPEEIQNNPAVVAAYLGH